MQTQTCKWWSNVKNSASLSPTLLGIQVCLRVLVQNVPSADDGPDGGSWAKDALVAAERKAAGPLLGHDLAFAKKSRNSARRFKFVHDVGNTPHCRVSYRPSFDHARINTVRRGNTWADNRTRRRE